MTPRLRTLPDGTVQAARAPVKLGARVRPERWYTRPATPMLYRCRCGWTALAVVDSARWTQHTPTGECGRGRWTWMPPDPGAFALRADTTPFPGLGVADREQLADGITVEFATVIDDRYTVTGRMGGLAATWSDPEWRRIAGWLRRV